MSTLARRPRTLVRLAAGACLLAALQGSAQAHRIILSAEAIGRTIRGYAYFQGGGKLRNAEIRVVGPGGQELGRTKTDDAGEFVFQAARRCDHTLVYDSGDGHRVECTIKAEELPNDLPVGGGPAAGVGAPATSSASAPGVPVPPVPPAPPAPPGDAAPAAGGSPTASQDIHAIVARAVRREFERHDQEVRFRDVIAGVGYILGLMGLVAYFKRPRPAGRRENNEFNTEHTENTEKTTGQAKA